MNKHGFITYNGNLTPLARNNRKQATAAEQDVWEHILRKRQLGGYKFLRQKPIAGYIVDFYCADLQWVIEIDGSSHDQRFEYDHERTRILQAAGLTVLRYQNDVVLYEIGQVRNDLTRRLPEKRVNQEKTINSASHNGCR